MLPNESRDLKRKTKRLFIFLAIVFGLDVFICFLLLYYTALSSAVCGVIIVAITTILYLLFLLLCAKIDKKRETKQKENKTKDPFSKA